MSDDWQPGDLTLCVSSRGWDGDGIGPTAGEISTVARVKISERDGLLDLHFQEYDPRDGFLASFFRKLRPHTPDAEAFPNIAAAIRHARRTREQSQ